MDTRPLLKLVCGIYFGNTAPLVEILVDQTPNSMIGSKKKLDLHYQGCRDHPEYPKLKDCKPKGALYLNVVKMYSRPDCHSFDVLARIISGTIKKNQQIKLMGEKYNPDDQEDMTIRTVKGLYIYQARYRVGVEKAYAGNWVLIEGLD